MWNRSYAWGRDWSVVGSGLGRRLGELLELLTGDHSGLYPSNLGLGGNVTQATSKTTGVTLNTLTGYIVMNSAALAAAGIVEFTVTNSQVGQRDTINLNLAAGAAASNAYRLAEWSMAASRFALRIARLVRFRKV
jgi:hypothetical protein